MITKYSAKDRRCSPGDALLTKAFEIAASAKAAAVNHTRTIRLAPSALPVRELIDGKWLIDLEG